MERKRGEARDVGEVVGMEALEGGGRDGHGLGAPRDSELSLPGKKLPKTKPGFRSLRPARRAVSSLSRKTA